MGGFSMKAECIECLIACNREIEFDYDNRRYSITYGYSNGKRHISVCGFYKEPVVIHTAAEVLNLKIGPLTMEKIFAKLPDSAFDIY